MDQRKSPDIQGKSPAIEAIILAGGFGTRLREVVPDLPKILAPIMGKPFIDFVVENLIQHGVSKIILSVGYRAEQIIEYVQRVHSEWPILFVQEEEPLGTGGALKKCLPLCEGEHVLVLNGDSLAVGNLRDFLDFHAHQNGIASVMVAPVVEMTSYGQIITTSDGRIVRFEEKPASTEKGFANAGTYFFKKTVAEYFPSKEVFSLEQELLPRLLEKGCFAYAADAFLDIGTPDRYGNAEKWIHEKQWFRTAKPRDP